jgi:hypothetical protein
MLMLYVCLYETVDNITQNVEILVSRNSNTATKSKDFPLPTGLDAFRVQFFVTIHHFILIFFFLRCLLLRNLKQPLPPLLNRWFTCFCRNNCKSSQESIAETWLHSTQEVFDCLSYSVMNGIHSSQTKSGLTWLNFTKKIPWSFPVFSTWNTGKAKLVASTLFSQHRTPLWLHIFPYPSNQFYRKFPADTSCNSTQLWHCLPGDSIRSYRLRAQSHSLHSTSNSSQK